MSKLRNLRLKSGLKQAWLARQIDIDPSHISRLERGLASPSPELAARLSAFFGGRISEMELLYPARRKIRNAAGA